MAANLLNNLLARLREAAFPGRPRKVVAAELGIDETALGKYERGDLRTPPVAKVETMLAAYGCDIHLRQAVLNLVELGGDFTGVEDRGAVMNQEVTLVSALDGMAARVVADAGKSGSVAPGHDHTDAWKVSSVRRHVIPSHPESGRVYIFPTAIATAVQEEDEKSIKQLVRICKSNHNVRIVSPTMIIPDWVVSDMTYIGRILLMWHNGRHLFRVSCGSSLISAFYANLASLEPHDTTLDVVLESLVRNTSAARRLIRE